MAATSEREKQDGGLGDDEWEGTSEMILGRKEWFDAWLEGERKCGCFSRFFAKGDSKFESRLRLVAEDQYNDIISSPAAWQLADDGSEDNAGDLELRPTNSARRVKILIEQITGTYTAQQLW